jgi:hypothetical protein
MSEIEKGKIQNRPVKGERGEMKKGRGVGQSRRNGGEMLQPKQP